MRVCRHRPPLAACSCPHVLNSERPAAATAGPVCCVMGPPLLRGTSADTMHTLQQQRLPASIADPAAAAACRRRLLNNREARCWRARRTTSSCVVEITTQHTTKSSAGSSAAWQLQRTVSGQQPAVTHAQQPHAQQSRSSRQVCDGEWVPGPTHQLLCVAAATAPLLNQRYAHACMRC